MDLARVYIVQRAVRAFVVDVAELNAAVAAALGSLRPPGTRRKYDSNVDSYVRFCEAAGLSHIPVTLQSLALYETWYVLEKPNAQRPGEPHSVNSLPGIESALRAAAREEGWAVTDATRNTFNGVPGFALTPSDMKLIALLHKSLAKLAPPRDGQKLPMRLALLMLMWELRARTPSWAQRRDFLWQALGHQGLLRISEVLKLRAGDVELLRDAERHVIGVKLALRDTKTAQYGDAATNGVQYVSVPVRTDAADVVGPLLAWMTARGALTLDGDAVAARAGDLLFPCSPDEPTKEMSKHAAAVTLRAGLLAIGVPEDVVRRYSGQSLRAGGATDMRDSGVPWHVIVMVGRWRSGAWKGTSATRSTCSTSSRG